MVSKINGGFAFKSENYTTKEKGIRVLRISDFNENGIKNHKMVFHPFNQSMQEFLLEDKDIVMCMTGGTVGKTLLITSLDEPMLVNQRVADIKTNNEISNEYIYVFLTSYFVKEIIKSKKNSTNDNISMNLIKSFLFPLPPLAEQERIVAEIEKYEPLIAEYDKLEQQSTKLDNEIKDKLKKSVLQYAIEGKLVPQNPDDEPASILLEKIRAEKKAQLGKKYVDSYIYKGDDNCYYKHVNKLVVNISESIPFEIPDNWTWCRLPDITNFILGKTPDRHTAEYWLNGNFPWFSISDMKDKSYISQTKEKISLIALKDKFNDNFSPKGTLIMSFKLTIGRTSIIETDAVHNEAIISIFPYENNSNIIRNYLLNTLGLLVGYIKQTDAIKGMTLNSVKLKSMLIPLPPLAEQERIVNRINEIFEKL